MKLDRHHNFQGLELCYFPECVHENGNLQKHPLIRSIVMTYLCYLKRSFTRNPKRHLSLFIVVTCALILPLLISIYRDSDAYGMEQYLLYSTKGETYHITNATEEDVTYFENIAGLTDPRFQDGTIYLSILSDEEWKDRETVVHYDSIVQHQVSETGNESLIVYGYSFENAHGISTDESGFLAVQEVLLVINMFIIVISTFSIQSAYSSHLGQFAPDVGTLVSCGANKRQIAFIFAVEFIVTFGSAALCSVLISIGVMKVLFYTFLELKNVQGLSWLLFHVEAKNIVLHLLLFFITLAAVFGITMAKYSQCSTWNMLRWDDNISNKKRKFKKLSILSTPASSLGRLWKQRTNKTFRTCLMVSIPIMTVFLIVFSYITLNVDHLTDDAEYELQITAKYPMEFGGFSAEDIEAIESINGVEKVSAEYEIAPDKYMILAGDPSAPPLPARILRYSDLASAQMHLSEYEVAVCRNQSMTAYGIGDTFTVGLSDYYVDSSDFAPTELYVSEFAEVESASWAVDIYLSDMLYSQITAMEPVNIIHIKLTEPSLSKQVQIALQVDYGGAEYEILNRQESVDAALSASPGIYALMLCVFCILFSLMVVIIYVKLCDYIESSRKTIRSLHILGASKRVIYRSYIKQDLQAAVLAFSIPLLICIPIIKLVAASLSAKWEIGSPELLVYITTALLIVSAYWLPVHCSLKNTLKHL